MKMLFLDRPNGKTTAYNVIAYYYQNGKLYVRHHRDGSSQNRDEVGKTEHNKEQLKGIPNETA